MSTKLGQEPAFPLDGQFAMSALKSNNFGMSKRFYAACAAMQGMLANMEFLKANGQAALQNGLKPEEFFIKTAYSLADELLKQENL